VQPELVGHLHRTKVLRVGLPRGHVRQHLHDVEEPKLHHTPPPLRPSVTLPSTLTITRIIPPGDAAVAQTKRAAGESPAARRRVCLSRARPRITPRSMRLILPRDR